jgi:hypothetical protein
MLDRYPRNKCFSLFGLSSVEKKKGFEIFAAEAVFSTLHSLFNLPLA